MICLIFNVSRFIAAVSGISQNEALFSKVVPKDQSFTENYSGI